MEKLVRSNSRLVLALVLLAAVAMLGTACAPQVASAQVGTPGEVSRNVITVSGTGQAFGRPDVAFIELGIDVVDGDVGEAIGQANATIDEVREALIAAGIAEENIQTSQFNVWTEEVVDPQTGRPQGERQFRVMNILRVKVENIDTVGDVIDAALGAGANTVHNLSFSIDDPAPLESTARTEAVADARARAEELAAALGVELGAPVGATETLGGGIPIIERVAADMGMGQAGGASISEGQLAVTVLVNVSYLIEQ